MKQVKYLIEYCKAQIGRPYWCGTYGRIASEAYYKAKKKQYPTMYWQNDYYKAYGQKVHDCCGLVKGAMWCNTVNGEPCYVGSEDHNVKGFYNVAKDKGKLKVDTPLIDGMLLFNSTFGHMGVYVAGNVINAKGHAYGVVSEKYISSRWAYWALCNYFDYNNAPVPVDAITVGDRVTMDNNAPVYGKKIKFASWVYNSVLTVMEISGNRCVVSVAPEKGITGAVHVRYLHKVK